MDGFSNSSSFMTNEDVIQTTTVEEVHGQVLSHLDHIGSSVRGDNSNIFCNAPLVALHLNPAGYIFPCVGYIEGCTGKIDLSPSPILIDKLAIRPIYP